MSIMTGYTLDSQTVQSTLLILPGVCLGCGMCVRVCVCVGVSALINMTIVAWLLLLLLLLFTAIWTCKVIGLIRKHRSHLLSNRGTKKQYGEII